MAYGDNRSSVATDTFDSSIDGNWSNGWADWGPYVWVTGGYINPSSVNDDKAMAYNGTTFADDQYSEVTVQNMGTSGDFFGALVRGQADSSTDESAYVGYTENQGSNQYRLYEITSSFGFTALADTTWSASPLVANDTLTMEVESTTLRLGTNEGSGDAERLTTTDATITSGYPGIVGYATNNVDNSQSTSWDGGDIGAAVTGPNLLTLLGVG